MHIIYLFFFFAWSLDHKKKDDVINIIITIFKIIDNSISVYRDIEQTRKLLSLKYRDYSLYEYNRNRNVNKYILSIILFTHNVHISFFLNHIHIHIHTAYRFNFKNQN